MFSIDIKELKIGAIANDGGMGTVLTSPGDIREDTVKLTPADDTVNSFKAIGKGQPVITSITGGDIEVTFDILTFDPDVMADLCGGSVTGNAPNKFWNMAVGNPPIIEKSVEILDAQDMTWQIARLQISAKPMGMFSKTDPNVIRVKAKILQPTKAGVSALAYGKKAA